jgi:hypothetical protein
MTRCAFLLAFVIGCIAVHAVPIKQSHHEYTPDSKHPAHGVEVNGLFNPMERYISLTNELTYSITPQLFERASEEHGNKITTYHDICILFVCCSD